MKKLMVPALFAGLLFTSSTRAALLLPLLNPVRSAIVTNISGLTNSTPLSAEQERQLRFLRMAQRNIDRRGPVSLFNDIQVLASVTTVLGRAFPDGEFDPVLETAISGYYTELLSSALTLSSNVTLLPPSTATSIAANNVADALEILGQFNPGASLSAQTALLTRAASRLRTAQLLTSRARSTVGLRDRFAATIDGRPFQANSVSGLSATYNAGSQFLTVTAHETSGASGNRSISLFIAGVTSGTTTHSLGSPATGTYAFLTVASPTNSASFTSSSGNAVITLNATTGTVSGRFSFNGTDTVGAGTPVRVTNGDFSSHF
jgi:hypothetical protein